MGVPMDQHPYFRAEYRREWYKLHVIEILVYALASHLRAPASSGYWQEGSHAFLWAEWSEWLLGRCH